MIRIFIITKVLWTLCCYNVVALLLLHLLYYCSPPHLSINCTPEGSHKSSVTLWNNKKNEFNNPNNIWKKVFLEYKKLEYFFIYQHYKFVAQFNAINNIKYICIIIIKMNLFHILTNVYHGIFTCDTIFNF